MEKYFFTFGQSHIQKDGTVMKDYWIEVEAESFVKGRQIFIEKFSSVFMEGPDKWAFQYGENGIDKSYFQKGCYTLIKQE